MDVKKEIEGCCTLCYKSFAEDPSLESVIVDEGVLELLTFLISGLNVLVLKGCWVCATCLSKVHEAYNFKSLHFERHLSIISKVTEIKEESFLQCHICKNVVEEDTCLSMLQLLEENNTKEIIVYLIPDSGLQNIENSLVCDMCKNSIIDFREILTLLSVYEKDGQIYGDDSAEEFTDDKNFLKVFIKEENNIGDIYSESTTSILNDNAVIVNGENNVVHLNTTNISSLLNNGKVKEELEDEPTAGCTIDVITDDDELEPLQCENKEVDVKMECEEDNQVEGTWIQTEEDARTTKVKQNVNLNCRQMYTCLLCGYQSIFRRKLIEHQLIHGMEESQTLNGFTNPLEQPQNNTKRKMTNQIVLNNKQKNFKPNTESDATKYTILNTHHRIYNCQHCQFSCRQQKELIHHIKSHYTVENDVFKCSSCSFQTKFRSNLIIHMLLHAKPESPDTVKSKQSEFQNGSDKNYEVPQYLCQFCDFSCHVQSAFFEHFNSHKDGQNVFKCNLCNFKTKYKSTLIIHKFTHEADRPSSSKEVMTIYKCEICDFETKFERELRIHAQKHKKEVNNAMYQCKVCGYQTYYKRTFDNHLQKHEINHCSICGFSCIDMTNFHEHMKQHDKTEPQDKTEQHSETEQHDKAAETILRCDSCDFQTKFKSNFTIHMLLHTSVNGKDEENDCEMIDEEFQLDGNSFKCDICPFRTKFRNQLKMHKSFIHRNYEEAKKVFGNDSKNQTYNCWYCSFKTEHVEVFSEHIDAHYQSFKCNRCDFEADSKMALKAHLWEHYRINQCKLCSFKCVNKDELDNHIQSHLTHKCPICSFACTKEALDEHLKLHKINSWESEKNPEKFTCCNCPFKTACQVEYMDHLLLHNKETFFHCHWCDYTTGSRRYFHRHVGRHTRTIYRCPCCKYRSYNKDNYDKHLQKHQKYNCEICDFTCFKETDLKNHLDVHDEQSENILKCNTCNFQTKFKSNLTIHQLLHMQSFEEKPLKCTLCSYETKMESFMRQHLRKHKYSQLKCQRCDFKTSYIPFLTKHMTEVHKETVELTIKTEIIDIT